MKKLLLFSAALMLANLLFAQEFSTQLASAKTAYSAGKLADAHFSLEQAMQEIDMIVGKEILKMLPEKMGDSTLDPKEDHVMANVGFLGATIHRSYGTNGSQVEIISNSPMIATLNSFLNMPILGGMMRNETTKVVKIQGYKSRLEKTGDNENGKPNYTLQVPFNNALLSITADGMTEKDVMAFADGIPVEKIAKMIQ